MTKNYIKKILISLSIILLCGFLFNYTQAGNGDIWGLGTDLNNVPGANITDPITTGMKAVEDGMGNEVVKDLTASEYIQKIVQYLLTFITLIATIYVIYAGFKVLTSSGDEETIKTSKKTILYVILGILLIWFAYEIAYFATSFGENSKNISQGGGGNGGGGGNSGGGGGKSCDQIYSKSECKNTLNSILCRWSDGSSKCEHK